MSLVLIIFIDVVWRHLTSCDVKMCQDKYIPMSKKEEEERRISLRLPESLALAIEKNIEESGLSFVEFLRRACREKLEREKDSRQLQENDYPYLSKKQIEALKYALQLPEIQEIILSITEKQK